MALVGGFVLAVAVSLSAAGDVWADRTPWLAQAHGWAQLEGWAGLFVAGMGLRLLPRFAGRRPLPKALNILVFLLLFAGVAVRTIAQPAGDARLAVGVTLGAQIAWSLGAALFGATVTAVLARGRKTWDAWRPFAFAGAAWWLAWAAMAIASGVDGARHAGLVDARMDDAFAWAVMLGAIGNFIWAVQSRSVPVFFGRRPPPFAHVAAPGLALNVGTVLLALTPALNGTARKLALGAGFALAGLALAALAPMAGAVWGHATRLRPRARPAARFVLAANLFALLAGVLLMWAGVRVFAEGEFAGFAARDAARHAFGVGVITLLIVGMAQLVAPFFALRRVESRSDVPSTCILGLIGAATVLRVASALLEGRVSEEARMHTAGLAGSLAWVGLVLFAAMVGRAVSRERAIKDSLSENLTVRTPPAP